MKYYLEWAYCTWFGLISLKEYCPTWDAKLNDLLDRYSDTAELNSYALLLGDNEIWISNRFFSYGNLMGEKTRPSIKTMIRLAKLEDSLRGVIEESEHSKYLDKVNKIK